MGLKTREKLKTRTEKDYLSSRHVPYWNEEARDDAREFLPDGPRARLTVERTVAFAEAARADAELRLTVLGTLRAHVTNGSEAPLGMFAVVMSALALFVSTALPTAEGNPVANFAWLILGIGVLLPIAGIARTAVAAHVRKVTATIWLAAYEDALRGAS